MPELPEVQTVVDTLRPRVAGQIVRRVDLLRDDFAGPIGFDWQHLVGREISDVRRRAKRIVFDLGGGGRFFAALGMTGRLLFCDAEGERPKHTHAVFAFDHGELRCVDPRRFGGLRWLGDDADEGTLGPEPLDLPAARLADRLLKTRRPVKSALLDQSFVAGLGNIYADEALHAAGIHPLTPCRDLDRPAATRLSRSIKTILKMAIAAGGSTIRDYADAAGNAGSAQHLHRVYARTRPGPCARCRTPVERVVLTGRSTHFCPVLPAEESRRVTTLCRPPRRSGPNGVSSRPQQSSEPSSSTRSRAIGLAATPALANPFSPRAGMRLTCRA